MALNRLQNTLLYRHCILLCAFKRTNEMRWMKYVSNVASYVAVVDIWLPFSCTFCVARPRHQGGAHGGRAPAKIVRAPAKITGLIMFHLGCQIQILVFWDIFGVKKIEKGQMATLCSMEAGVDGWVTLTLIPPVTRLKCTVRVLSLFFWKHRCSDMARV